MNNTCRSSRNISNRVSGLTASPRNRSTTKTYLNIRNNSLISKNKYGDSSKLIKQSGNEISQTKVKLNHSENPFHDKFKYIKDDINKINEIDKKNRTIQTNYGLMGKKLIQSDKSEKTYQFNCDQMRLEIEHWKSELSKLNKCNEIQYENIAQDIRQLKKEKLDIQRKFDQVVKINMENQLKLEKSIHSNKRLILKLSYLDSRYKILQKENDDINSKYFAEINLMKSKLMESDKENKRLKKDYVNCKFNLKQLRDNNRKNNEMKSKYLLDIENLKSAFKNIDEENEILLNNYDDCISKFYLIEKDKKHLLKKYSHLKKEKNKLKSEHDKLLIEIEQLKSKIKEFDGQNKNEINQSYIEEQISSEENCKFQTKNKNFDCSTDQMLIEMNNLKLTETKQIVRNNYDKDSLKLIEENDNLKQIQLSLETEIKDLTVQRDKCLSDIKCLRSALTESDETKKIFQKNVVELNYLQQKNSQLENEKAIFKGKIDQISKDNQLKLRDLSRSNKNLKFESNQSKDKCISLQTENDHIDLQEIECLKSTIEKIYEQSEKGKEKLQNKYSQLQTKNKNLTSEYDKLFQVNEKFKIKEIQVQDKILQVTNKLNQSDKSLEDKQHEYSQLQIKYKNLNFEYDKLNEKNANMQLEMNKIVEENKTLQNNFVESTSNPIQSGKDKENLLAGFENLKSDHIEILKKTKIDVQKKDAEFNNKFNQSEQDMVSLKSIYEKVETQNSSESQIAEQFLNSTIKVKNIYINNELMTEESTSSINDVSEPKIISTLAIKPMGFKNPKGYCYLNCVVQVLASCDDFKKDIENCDCGKYFDGTDDSIFIKGLFDLIYALRSSNYDSLNESLNVIQQYISESSLGDDVYKCFMNILSRVSKVIKTNIGKSNVYSSIPVTIAEKAQSNFEKFRKRNPGFVFNNFYGQLTFQMICDVCQNICNESFQVIKSMTLAVPKSESSITLENCINLFFSDSQVNVEDPMKCECEKGSKTVKSRTKLTHGPKYLFIYLNRGSYTDNGAKIDTFVTCVSKTINIEVYSNSPLNYKLISVIDHVGNTFYGHYYCKSNFEGSQWWLLNDELVKECSNDVVTKDTIVFLFKRNHGPIEF